MKNVNPVPNLTEIEIHRFWKKVDKTCSNGCWEWVGYTVPSGYGQVGFRYKLFLTHRVAWKIFTGYDPAEMFVLHKCDNPKCLRFEHLFLGTDLDNMKDMIAKGRAIHSKNPRGEKNSKTKLNEIQINEIWRLHLTEGLGERKLAVIFNVTPPNIHSILSGNTWKHLIPKNIVPVISPKQGFRRTYPTRK